MKKTLSIMAAAAILTASTAIAPALAQTNNTTPVTPAQPGAQTGTMTPAAPGTTNSTTGGMNTTTMGAASGEYLTQQSETQVSANDYIGKAIYNGENSSIGDVNDLILEDNGGIVAVVVGVGGFLGIGEKSVALPMSKINMTRDPANNTVRLTTTETAEALKSAPEFKTLDDTTTSSTTAPATGTATPPAATTTRP